MTYQNHVDGPGEHIVRLLRCLERSGDQVERMLDLVDTLAVGQSAADPDSILTTLRAQGPHDLVEPLEAWLEMLVEFDAAVARFIVLRHSNVGAGDDKHRELGVLTAEIRQYRRAVNDISADIGRRVASHIDVAAAHEMSAD